MEHSGSGNIRRNGNFFRDGNMQKVIYDEDQHVCSLCSDGEPTIPAGPVLVLTLVLAMRKSI